MSRRLHPGIRVAAALLAAGCVASQPAPPPQPAPASAPASPAPPSPKPAAASLPHGWGAMLDSLPAAARPFLHPTAAHLPPFPGESPAALTPASWAPSVRDSDRVCVLELRTYVRGTPVTLSDIRQRKAGQSLSARYLCGSRTWRAPRYAGPFYVWDKDDNLLERTYRTTDGSRYREELYQYRGNGSVWAYRHRERNEDQTDPSLMVDEYFDRDGTLAGFSVERTGPDSLSVHRRRGAPIEAEAFRKWASEFR